MIRPADPPLASERRAQPEPGSASPEDWPAGGAERTPRFTLNGFTGPLERLLALARAHQVDLACLSLVALVDRLAAALRQAPPATALGEKGDWVVMAAWLLQLRSVLLLPPEAPARQQAAAEAEQLRARLLALHAARVNFLNVSALICEPWAMHPAPRCPLRRLA